LEKRKSSLDARKVVVLKSWEFPLKYFHLSPHPINESPKDLNPKEIFHCLLTHASILPVQTLRRPAGVPVCLNEVHELLRPAKTTGQNVIS
jgi:hypothetical protein